MARVSLYIMTYSDRIAPYSKKMFNISRILDLRSVLERKSCFLLGPRQTGKSWLIKAHLPQARIYNLLDVEMYRALSRRPSLIREELREDGEIVVVDEIQKLPELLNEIHLAIEERKARFLMTGSSARKLRRQGVNLLGGRAKSISFHPFVSAELKDLFDLHKALSRGLLPPIYFSDSHLSELKDYVEMYLREEIAMETAIRNLPAFSRFLDVAALCNGQLINYTEIGNNAQVAPTTVREYFNVIETTLIAKRLPAWRESKKRKAISCAKFYFFDIGVVRLLQGRNELQEASSDFGEALETLVFHELSAYVDYTFREPLSFWRSTSGFEVDFLMGNHTAIEVKAARTFSPRHLKGLKALMEEGVFKRYILVNLGSREHSIDGIDIIPLPKFLELLWKDSIERKVGGRQ